ncbi:hypothetical protein [Lewinella sp. LCG006]|uniref:hypothetical protein n=1 Tax=Lewinella sp. LCG006 TaxID=3231911 RepID=UPI003461005C
MDYNTAKRLLERYFEGNSTLAEEAQLRSYFQQEDLPADMLTYRPLFQFFTAAGNQKVSEAFTERLETIGHKTTASIVPFRKVVARWAAIAAMIALGLAAWMLVPDTKETTKQTAIDWSQFEPQNEEEALRITTAALQKTSSSLRRGMEVATNELQSVKKLVQPW